mgnify:CR=1 FL=1
MRDACARAVSNAMGRELRPAELADIEARIARNMRALARQNPSEWAGKSEAERLTESGAAAAREIVAEARRRKDNLETRVLRMQALTDFVDGQIAEGRDASRQDAFARILAPKADAGGAPEGGSLDQKAQGIYSDAVASLVDLFEAGKRRGIWRFIPFNEPGTNSLLRRALAGETNDVPPEFVRMAKAAHEYIDLMRRRYNAAGGTVGKLEDWGEPHRWSDVRVLDQIKKRGRAAVANDFALAAVRERYVHEDGRLFTQDEIRAFMDEALTTIVSDGANKRLAGERPDFATSVAANRHRAHREIHLRQDAVEGMLDTYSELGAMESLLLHMRTLARDVALIETFGPNAELTARQMIDQGYDADVLAMPDKKNELQTKRDHNEYLFDYLAGNVQGRRNKLNATMSFLRSLATFKSLGFTVWSSLTDPVVMQHVAAARGLDAGRLWINDVAMFSNNGRRWAKRAGLITDTVAGYADRLSFDHLAAPDIGARAASFTLKATGLNWVTEARRGAYGLTMMDAIGHLVRHNESLAKIKDADDSALLRLLNVTDDAWAVWRMAKLETMGANHTVLSPQAIHAIDDATLLRAFPDKDPALVRQDATTQLLGIVKDELNTAVTTAGSRERAVMLGDQTKSGAGTIGGELRRAFVLFRSYPWTFMTRQWELAKSIDGGGNRAAYAASLVVTTWMTGILINWIYDLLNGRDPGAINPDSAEGRRNITAGLMRGGGLGIFGDFLFANSDPGMRSQSVTSTLTGPVLSQIDEVQQLTLGNLNQAAAGEDNNFGPEAVAFAQRQAFPNWFWSRALMDRYVFNALQEELEPGYNARRTQRQFTNRGTTYWLPAEPGAPARAPDWSRAIEGDMPERQN